ncbi:MAG TPA: hypothetical protein VGE72_13530 [Azospirillum sp.]
MHRRIGAGCAVIIAFSFLFAPAAVVAQTAFPIPRPPNPLPHPAPSNDADQEDCRPLSGDALECRYYLSGYDRGAQVHPQASEKIRSMASAIALFRGKVSDFRIVGIADAHSLGDRIRWENVPAYCRILRYGAIAEEDKGRVRRCYSEMNHPSDYAEGVSDWGEVDARCKASMTGIVSNLYLGFLRACRIHEGLQEERGEPVHYDFVDDKRDPDHVGKGGNSGGVRGSESRLFGGAHRKVEISFILRRRAEHEPR